MSLIHNKNKNKRERVGVTVSPSREAAIGGRQLPIVVADVLVAQSPSTSATASSSGAGREAVASSPEATAVLGGRVDVSNPPMEIGGMDDGSKASALSKRRRMQSTPEASSGGKSDGPFERPGPRSSKTARRAAVEESSDSDSSVVLSSASAPSVAERTALPPSASGDDRGFTLVTRKKRKTKKAGRRVVVESEGSPRVPSSATLPVQGIAVTVPWPVAEGAPATTILSPAEVMARAEAVVAEARSFAADPVNKVNRGTAAQFEGSLSGLMSLLRAAVGRVEGLSGECAALRESQKAILGGLSRQVAGAIRGSAARAAPLVVAPQRVAPAAAPAVVGTPRTFASVLGGGAVNCPAVATVPLPAVAKRRKRSTRHAVLIRPTGGDMPAAEVKERLMSLVNPAEASVRVRGVRTVAGGVVVETASGADLDYFKSSQALVDGGLTVSEAGARPERIIIFGVPASTTEELLVNTLRAQAVPQADEAAFRKDVRLLRKLAGKSGDSAAGGDSSTHWVLELSSEVAAKLGRSGRVFLGWHSCTFREYVDADRCFRCLGFGHTATFCAARARVCGWCSGSGHSAAECPSKADRAAARCVNCSANGLPAGHGAYDGACPLYRAAIVRARLRAPAKPAEKRVAPAVSNG